MSPLKRHSAYADDFIVTCDDKDLLENEVLPVICKFMEERGLKLSEDKTVITHIDDGFDFLGCNIRKYNGKLLTKPSKSNIKAFLAKVRGIIRQQRTAKQEDLIFNLNPVIRGWVNFQRFNVSSEVFQYVDFQIWNALWKWAQRRHKLKGKRWIAQRYFHLTGNRKWTFSTPYTSEDGNSREQALIYASDTKITRFTKVQSLANPYDEEWQVYFEERETDRMRINLQGRKTLTDMFKRQKGLCGVCGERMTVETGCKYHTYKEQEKTLHALVHPECHTKLHS